MKKLVIILSLVGAFGLGSLTAQQTRLDLPWGYIETHNNEVSIVSTVDDPSGLRLGSIGDALGKVSFNVIDKDGSQHEIVLLQGKRDSRYRGGSTVPGELTVHVEGTARVDEDAMVPVLTLRHDGAVFHVPVSYELR